MTDLHRYPLLRTDMPLQRMGTTMWAFFSHGSLPVLQLKTSFKDRERFKVSNPQPRTNGTRQPLVVPIDD